MVYYMHETIRNPKAARKAAPTRHRAAGKRLYPVGRSEKTWLFTGLSVPLAANVPERRRGSLEAKAGTGTSAKADAQPKENINANFAERASFARVQYRPMDPKTHCRGDREKVRDRVSSQSPLAFFDSSWLELPEAREESPRARREGHRALETLRMAAYKKTRIGLEPISYFLTKAAFSWFPISDGLGRPAVKHHIFPWQETGRRYRPYPPSAFLQKEREPVSIYDSILIRTLKRLKSKGFCTISCDISKALLFSCGIEACLIGLLSLRSVSESMPGLMRTSFPAMRPNLIPLNLYGHSLKGLLPILFQRIWVILKTLSYRLCTGFAIPSVSCGHVSGHRICLGGRISITYA
jgi:hypothetical protein